MATATIGGIPVYNALIEDEDCGMMRISLVDDPAVMSNFLAFDNNKVRVSYAISNEEKRLVLGVVMRADFPIYRIHPEMGEFYIMYSAETIRKMAEKYLVENRQNLVNLDHKEDTEVDGVQMVQYFIKDSAKGISPEGFDVADGSLFAEFHIENDEVWDAIKDGTYKGFSLEGVFGITPNEDEEKVDEIVNSLDGKFSKLLKKNSMTKLSRFKAALLKLFAEFGNITTDKGILSWDGDDDLKVGDSVFIQDAEGNQTQAEDGDYTTEDNKVIVVADGVVAEIKDVEVTETFAEVATDNGTLFYEGELESGTEVFVETEGERTAAPDGDYKTEDGKTIKVADGKVTEIVDAEADNTTTVEAEKMSRIRRIAQAFSESYDEKVKKIYDAILALGFTWDSYIVECGDDFAILYTWESETFTRFDVSWDAEGNAIVSNPTEVETAFVPVNDTTAEDTAKEIENLRKENKELSEKLSKLEKMSGSKPAHEVVKANAEVKTGNKGVDRIAHLMSL